MIRSVLVGFSEVDWRLFRQDRWMAEVRRDPAASSRPRRHFDIAEDAFRAAVAAWEAEGASAGRDRAIALLIRLGAVEVHAPGGGG